MEAKIYKVNAISASALGAFPAQVQVSIESGLGIHIVGLPDQQAKEMLLRVVTALQANGKRIPGKKIVIYIKHGPFDAEGIPGLDLPVYVAMSAMIDGRAPEDLDPKAWYTGRIDLTGNVLRGEPLDSIALRDIIENGYLVCPLGSFPTVAMISNVNAI